MENEATKKKYWGYGLFIVAYTLCMWVLTVLITVDGANVVIPAAVERFGCTQSQASAPFSYGAYISMVVVFVLASTMLKIGIKKILIPVIFAMGILFFFVANTTSLGTYQILMSIIIALMTTVSFTPGALIANWFIKKRGTMLGVLTCGAPFSTAIVTPSMARSVAANGFSASYVGLSVAIIIYGILGVLFLKEKPADVGCKIDNGETDLALLVKNTGPLIPLKEILSTKLFWIISLGWCFNNIINIGVMGRIVSTATSVGFTRETALTIMTIGGLLAIPFSLVWGILDDKYGSNKANVAISIFYICGASLLFCGTSGLVGANIPYAALIVVYMALAIGGMPNLQPSIVAYTFGAENFINVYRYVNIFQGFAKGTAFAIIAKVFDTTGSYAPSFVIFGILAVCSTIGFFQIKGPYVSKAARTSTAKKA